jgi:hypothetical protein
MTQNADSRTRRWWRKRRKFVQCLATADFSGGSYPCTRPRWHLRYDPLHFNVVFRIAWEPQMVQVPYPPTESAVAAIRRDRGYEPSHNGRSEP